MVFYSINILHFFLSYDEILSILELFCHLSKEKQLFEKDCDYERMQKDKEIEKLKQQVKDVNQMKWFRIKYIQSKRKR